MDKETLPRWGWLLLGLFIMAMLANVLNVAVLGPAGLPEAYYVITVITGMAPVLIYIGVWYDEERQHYWEHPRSRIFGDLVFVFLGALIGSSIVFVGIAETGLPRLVVDIAAMAGGFMLGWGLFWWRNPEIYQRETAT